jgi:hypothetical protein
VLAAMERAVRYHACSLSSLERILGMQAAPKAPWHSISRQQRRTLEELSEKESVKPRSSAEYQYLLFEENEPDDPPEERRPPRADPSASGDAENSSDQ